MAVFNFIIGIIFVIFGLVGITLAIGFLSAFLGLYKAYWLHLLWLWFCVPIGLPNLSILSIYGILIIYNLMTVGFRTDKDKNNIKTKEYWIDLIMWILALPLVTLIAYLVKLWLS